jgi:multisubunit Na+/H+ antiporter MnhB subunit
MILGRPTNLWLGLTSAVVGAVTVTLIALGYDAQIVGTLSGAWGAVGGAIVVIVAGQPPTLAPGDTFKVATPGDQDNVTHTVR